jgi:predicted RNA methylase
VTAGPGTVAAIPAAAVPAVTVTAVTVTATTSAAASRRRRDVTADVAVHSSFRQIERIERRCQKDDAHRCR